MNKDIVMTDDGEWDEDELLSLVMDECYRICNRLNGDIAKGINVAWYDNSLLYAENLCQKVTYYKSMVDIYNSQGDTPGKCLEGFEQWIKDTISMVVDSNRYRHYK